MRAVSNRRPNPPPASPQPRPWRHPSPQPSSSPGSSERACICILTFKAYEYSHIIKHTCEGHLSYNASNFFRFKWCSFGLIFGRSGSGKTTVLQCPCFMYYQAEL